MIRLAVVAIGTGMLMAMIEWALTVRWHRGDKYE